MPKVALQISTTEFLKNILFIVKNKNGINTNVPNNAGMKYAV